MIMEEDKWRKIYEQAEQDAINGVDRRYRFPATKEQEYYNEVWNLNYDDGSPWWSYADF